MKCRCYELLGLLFLAILTIEMCGPVYASPLISASIVKYSPSPALAGQYVDLWVQIVDQSDVSAKDVSISFIDSFPFMVVGNKQYTVTSLTPYQSYVFKFHVLVDNRAVEGINYAKLRVIINKNSPDNTSIEFSLPVEVKLSGEALSLVKYFYSNNKASPGSTIPLTLTISNNGNNDVHNVLVSLDLSNLPFVPTNTPSTMSFSYLQAGKEKNITIPLYINTHASEDSYLIPLTISYVDASGSHNSVHYFIGIEINKPISYLLSISPSYLTCPGKQTITFRVDNDGIGTMKRTTIRISNGLNVLGNREKYIGDIDSDDYGTADFNILCNSQGKKNVSITIRYYDDHNKLHEDHKHMEINTYSVSQLYDMGIIHRSHTWYYLLGALILLLVYYIYKRQRRNKKTKGK